MAEFPPITGTLRLDHVAIPYPTGDGDSRIRAFWEPLGMRVTERIVDGNIDNSGPGTRYSVGNVHSDSIVYYPDGDDRHAGHLAFAVDLPTFVCLIAHPDRVLDYGTDGISRWGNSDASLFLREPYGAMIEFRCASYGK